MSLLRLRDITVSFGGPLLLNHLNLTIEKGDRLCLVGRNGSGKSTLLKVLTGDIKPDEGLIESSGNIRIARLEQDVPDTGEGSVFHVVASGLGDIAPLLDEYHRVIHLVTEDPSEENLNKLEVTQRQLEAKNGWELEQRVETTLSKLSLDGDMMFADLSGGIKRRALLAKALVQEPDLLLLDEPTNHLDIESIQWLEEFLANYQGSLLFISHDRSFLDKLATRVVDLDRGKLSDWPGSYQNYLRRKQEQLEAEEKQNALFDKKLSQEEVWIRQGIKARRTRNEGRVRALKTMRQERSDRRNVQGKASFVTQVADRSGQKVIDAKNIQFTYSNKPIVNDLTTLILRGDKVGLIGPNGVGKSTLLHLLLGKLEPQSGSVDLGTNLQIAYFDQLRDQLDESQTVRENIGEGSDSIDVNGQTKHVIGYLQDFLFTPERANTPVKALSGGEKNRLLLAKIFSKPSNLMVMDEPTNDLDIETLELLEELVSGYTGTLLLVSHDRTFINNVVTSTLVFEGNGDVNDYIGSYDDWIRQRPEKGKLKKAPEKAAKLQKSTNNATTKLSYKENKELESLPKDIEKYETLIASTHEQLADPKLYQEDPNKVTDLQTELTKVEALLETAFARWEELEEKQGGNS
ncbi:ABC transporter ATP-binding protein [Gammaproteobacteria bacterium 42_54_T18]|nr:ABC transporter ATP-binding protein [Gammaproteobacteria bacterium 42_54_T18]